MKLESTMSQRKISPKLENEEMQPYICRKDLEAKEPFIQNKGSVIVKQIKDEHVCRKCSKILHQKM